MAPKPTPNATSASNYGTIDFRKQVTMILPPMLRSGTVIDFLASLVQPLQSLMEADWRYIYSEYIKSYLTGQVIVMQAGLNYLFNITVAPYILIETVRGEGAHTYMYNEAEVDVLDIYNEDETFTTYVLNTAEGTSPEGYDFIVKLPVVVSTPENFARLRAQVDLIKATGTTYTVITY